MKEILQTYENTFTYQGIDCFALSITLPGGFASQGKKHPVDRYYKYKQKQITNYAKKYFLPYAKKDTDAAVTGAVVFKPWLLKGTCRITYRSENYLSVLREVTVFRGRTKYAYTAESETWDLLRKQICPIGTFVTVGKVIKPYINEYSKRNPNLKKYPVKHFNKDNYYLMPQGIVVFYPDKKLHITITNTKDIYNRENNPQHG